ncbi:TlpA family protein disulfide reductase [Pedobacter steynii]|uniref:Thioredoxin domain-containing protein n=1 Tax=Pedobacter steynii TaxID=430522 RepID=A0A1D7QN15_9SPHI|nr:TlpA disulfide reductase family protein [Pedobacter steynii]AOM80054.1 hypothetical protein BFS30_24550 [Pedobacter steynii]
MKKSNKMIQGLILFFIIVIACKVKAQPTIKALSVGDTVPDLAFRNLINYKGKLSLGMLSDKLVIIDFWTTGCPSCVEAIPALEQLQQEFADRIQIIMVNPWEKKEAIIKRVNAMKILRPGIGLTTLPNAYGDTVWRNIFPHAGVPHHIWIYKNKVIASTFSRNATREHIAKILAGEKVNLSLKVDLQLSGYDVKKSSLVHKGHPTLKPMFYSVFFKGIHGIGRGASTQIDTMDGVFIRRFYNQPILDLYKIAFGVSPYEKNRIRIDVADSVSMEWPRNNNDVDSWFDENCFSYEIALPVGLKERLTKHMQTDLNRYFSEIKRIEGFMQKNEYPCWILQKGSGNLNQQLDKESKVEELDSNTVNYQNQPFSVVYYALRSRIENSQHKIMLVDETGLNVTTKLSVIIPQGTMDFGKLKYYLNKAGLTIKKGKRKVDVLTIRTIKHANKKAAF